MDERTLRRARIDAIRLRRDAPSAPPGFEIVDAIAGMGKTSLVAKVRRLADGALFAWKLGVDDSAETRHAMDEQILRSRHWVRLGISRAPSDWAPDGRTLLQPWVEGVTLRAVVKSSPVLTDPGDPRRAALIETLRRLALARTFVSGLNAMNLKYDGGQWQVLDSGHVRECATASEAWELQRADVRRKWTRGPMSDRMHDVETFLRAADAALALPPAPFNLKRWWRRMRGR